MSKEYTPQYFAIEKELTRNLFQYYELALKVLRGMDKEDEFYTREKDWFVRYLWEINAELIQRGAMTFTEYERDCKELERG